ncbi:RidA family protein [Kaistia dalseonensis]|uniref:Enamine deaminase RidA (YjgF/YER057c/UK114 family) n=1 Tax=Kaistia dalseonensis TaxID=410840 RepID=A0ABU0H513_9HYPH|nr:RidA family protein [Kaistia dalseonensis]MCX5494026.1 RidA family protein [Kaistia dalseonensis]MDQ0436604.1 enamine deaminase RidA (YjgF/YER057c/UK114 family) [Kaistia dalseonensis]
MSISERLASLAIVLPRPPAPVGNFTPAVRTGNLLFISGLAPADAEGRPIVGKVGADFTAEEAQGFARLVGLNLLAVIEAELGSLDRVSRIVKLLGMVNTTPDFTRHPFVIDGCSNLFGEVFPQLGRHARSAVGVASLPFGIPVEIEAVIEFRD